MHRPRGRPHRTRKCHYRLPLYQPSKQTHRVCPNPDVGALRRNHQDVCTEPRVDPQGRLKAVPEFGLVQFGMRTRAPKQSKRVPYAVLLSRDFTRGQVNFTARRLYFGHATRPRDDNSMDGIGSVLGEASGRYSADVCGDNGGASRGCGSCARADGARRCDGAGGAGTERCGCGGSGRKSLRD